MVFLILLILGTIGFVASHIKQMHLAIVVLMIIICIFGFVGFLVSLVSPSSLDNFHLTSSKRITLSSAYDVLLLKCERGSVSGMNDIVVQDSINCVEYNEYTPNRVLTFFDIHITQSQTVYHIKEDKQ